MYPAPELTSIPGDPGTVSAGANHLAEVASTLTRLASTLNAIADEDVTVGASVDSIRTRTREASGNVKAAEPRYSETSAALTDYAVALADAQSRFNSAQSSADGETGSIRYYQEEIWELERENLRLMVSLPDPEKQAEREQRLRYLRGKLSEHQQSQQAAQAEMDAAVQDWRDAGDQAARRITPVLGQLNDTLLDHVGAFVEGLGDFLAGIAEWIANVLDTLITTLLLIVMVVVAIVVLLAAIVMLLAFLPALIALFASGVLTWDLLLEQLIGIVLVLVPLLTGAVLLLMLREAATPTPTVHQRKPYSGTLIDKGDRSDYEDLFINNGDLDEAGGKDNTIVEVVQVMNADGTPSLDENGNPIWRVTLPSTQDWQLGMGGAFGDNGGVNDLGSNLALILTPEQQAAYERAVTQAMLDAGIGPNDPVMLAGWSQGGILAGAMASDPNSPFNIQAITVAGAPIDHMDIPDDVAVLAFQHDGDAVPRLDGTPPHQGPNWATVNQTSTGEGYPHNADYYAETAKEAEGNQNGSTYPPNMSDVMDDQSRFFSDYEVAYEYEFSEKDSAFS